MAEQLKIDKDGKRKVGTVTPEERDEIQGIFERKNGLTELFQTIKIDSAEGQKLYDKVVADMGIITTRFKNWWNEKAVKYNWENIPGYTWEINFETCDIYLRK